MVGKKNRLSFKKKPQKRVVIIGGGFVGSHVARSLENDFSVTLIDTKDYFEFTPGVLRTIVEPKHTKNIQALHSSYLKKAIIQTKKVQNITKKYVQAGKENIPYDYAVLAMGSRYNVPFKQSNILATGRARILRNHYEDMQKAKRILIIGGGIVGVELAAELITAHPEKKIIIAHSRKELLNTMPKPVQEKATRWLKKHGVQLILGSRVTETKNDTLFITKKGRNIKADMAFMCTGLLPNTECVHTSKDFSKVLSERAAVCVDKYLCVEGRKNVFAGGDLINLREAKLAQNSIKHAHIIAENIRRSENKKPLLSYTSQHNPYIISLGKHTGILCYKNFSLGGFIPGLLKQYVEWKVMKHITKKEH